MEFCDEDWGFVFAVFCRPHALVALMSLLFKLIINSYIVVKIRDHINLEGKSVRLSQMPHKILQNILQVSLILHITAIRVLWIMNFELMHGAISGRVLKFLLPSLDTIENIDKFHYETSMGYHQNFYLFVLWILDYVFCYEGLEELGGSFVYV